MTAQEFRFAFFGSAPLGVATLDALEAAGFVPVLVVTSGDSVNRKKEVVVSPEKTWAQTRGIPVLQPTRVDEAFLNELRSEQFDFFVVAAYGKLLPKALLDIPERGTVNVHPSLLPKLRGPSPIRSAILQDEKETGVSVIELDEEMDHGPLLGQRKVAVPEWPPRASELEALLAKEGGELLAEVLPQWLDGSLAPTEQDHTQATFCQMIRKNNGHISLHDDAYTNLLKIRALEGWPGAFTFFERAGKKIRVAIIDAHLEGNKLVIDVVKPEGKSEMPYDDFARSGVTPIT